MIARAGASVSLSLLIVAVAAVVVHRPEPQGLSASIAAPPDRPASPPSPAPVATPSAPWPEVERPRAAGSARPNEPPSRTRPRPVPKRPESAFTKVAEGETLADVVRRIYGPGGDVEAVWKANQDQLPTPGAGLRSGMILRTP